MVKIKDGGRDWDVVDCWFLIYGREEGVLCVRVHTRGCECHGKKAVTWRFIHVPVFIVPWTQFLRVL